MTTLIGTGHDCQAVEVQVETHQQDGLTDKKVRNDKHKEAGLSRYEEGMEVYRSLVYLAEKGDTEVQMTLARMRIEGKVVPKDLNIAVFWLTQAANLGSASAQTYLAQVLLSEQGMLNTKDSNQQIKQGFEWLYSAAQQGEPQAQYQFATLILKSPQNNPMGYSKNVALDFLQKCVQSGKNKSCYELGLKATLGAIPHLRVPSSQASVIRVASLDGLAQSGNINAMYLLGLERPDPELTWLRKAARGGHPEACFDLAALVLNDKTLLKAEDPTLLELLDRSASEGYEPAMQLLGTLLSSGSRFPRNQELGVIWLEKAKKARENSTETKAANSEQKTVDLKDATK